MHGWKEAWIDDGVGDSETSDCEEKQSRMERKLIRGSSQVHESKT